MKTHTTFEIATWFLEKAKSENQSINVIKLQRLIYFAHGWSLALYDIPLIDEYIEAWDFGPVISSIYHEFKQFGSGSITEFSKSNVTDKDTIGLLECVWGVYGSWTSNQLSNLAHIDNSPWHKTFLTSTRRNTHIPDDLIKEDFKEKL